jgi:hypothetical protein
LPNAHDKFILDTEASDTAISIKLLQNQNGEERVIAYGSFTLAPAGYYDLFLQQIHVLADNVENAV